MTRVGVRSTPWSGSQLSSSVNREFSEYGPRVFANLGLTQSFKVGEAWAMDVGVDRSDTLDGRHGRALQRERAARLGLHRRRLPRDVLRRAVPRRRVDDHVAHRAARRRPRGALVVHGRLLPRARRRPRAVGDDALARQRDGDRRTAASLDAQRLLRLSAARQPLHRARAARPDAGRARRPADELRDDAVRQQRQLALAVRQPLRARHAGRRALREEHDRRRRGTRAGRRCSAWTCAAT